MRAVQPMLAGCFFATLGRASLGVIYVELGTHGSRGGVEGDELKAQEVVAVFNALGNGNRLDALVGDLEKY